MEVARIRQRSASQSSLHSSYRAHARQSPASSMARRPSRRLPLRSVNENATLLRSPGPLASMLKTTTETGDIGIFSIKTGPSPSPYCQPRQARPRLPDSAVPPGRQSHNRHAREEQVPHRSYRDTTSEIISLYGGDNQQYWLRSASPVYEDGQRSYSLTTSSSRQVLSQKSSATVQSHASAASGPSLQRPRSPFPYPTRLKRLGVRPASPALADNGGIDYSRMVELDRVSQRTVHGSYRPTFTPGARRPPPLALRAEANRSTASLPSRASPGSCHFGLGPAFARTPSSSLSATSRLYERCQGSSTDQSLRSASLTSIVEMYQRPMTANSTVPALRPGGSFYYDYSEEFAKPAPLLIKTEPQVPLCPIPQRTGDTRRPMVLRDDTQVDLDDVSPTLDKNDALTPEGKQQGLSLSMEKVLCESSHGRSRGQSVHGPGQILDAAVSHAASDEPSTDEENASETGLPMTALQRSSLEAAPLLGESRGAKSQARTTGEGTEPAKSSSADGVRRLSKSLGAALDIPRSLQTKRASQSLPTKRSSQSGLSRLRCTLDPALADFASLFTSFDRLTRTSLPPSGEDGNSSDEHDGSPRHDEGEAGDDGHPTKPLGPRPSHLLVNMVAAESNAQKSRHRRNAAALEIDTLKLSELEKNRKRLARPREEMTILSPEPISPLSQLRVKNSIPQLMKALPPLPREAHGVPDRDGSSFLGVAEDPKSWAQRGLCLTMDSCREEDGLCRDSPASSHPLEARRFNSLRSRIGRAASSGGSPGTQVASEKAAMEGQETLQRKATPECRPRLKLKLSSSRLGQARFGLGRKGTRTNNRLKQCNSLAELAARSQKGADSHEGSPEGFGRDEARQRPRWAASEGGGGGASRAEGVDEVQPSPPLSDQFNIPYPPSPEEAAEPCRLSVLTAKETLSEMRSLSLEAPVVHRGLRQKLSMFRLRVTGGLGSETCKDVEGVGALDGKGLMANDGPEAEARALSTQSERVGGRMRKWASDARQAVRLYVRRTLDRSSRPGD